LGIDANWNLITGFPGEQAASYRSLADIIPKIFHFPPPTGLGNFEVHRFSPYYNNPAEYGIQITGADWRYQYVFPSDAEQMARLVYRFNYRTLQEEDLDLIAERRKLNDLVISWWKAAKDGAYMVYSELPQGQIHIVDGRSPKDGDISYRLSVAESVLYKFVDDKRFESRLCSEFKRLEPFAYEELGGDNGISHQLEDWINAKLVLRLGGYVLGLAVRSVPQTSSYGGLDILNLENDHAESAVERSTVLT